MSREIPKALLTYWISIRLAGDIFLRRNMVVVVGYHGLVLYCISKEYYSKYKQIIS